MSDQSLKAQLAEMKEQLAELDPGHLKDGSWFQAVLQRSAGRFIEKRARRDTLERWRTRYPDSGDDRLERHIVTGSSRRAAMVGGLGGAAVSAAGIAAVVALGLPAGAAFLLVLAEVAVLERLQVNMVFTLGELRGHELHHDDMHDVGLLYGNVLKVKGTTRAATYTRDGATALFRAVGMRFLQATAVKYALPLLSVGVGGGMNYLMTRQLGRHAGVRFSREAAADGQLDRLAEQERALRGTLISLMVLMAGADGHIDKQERDLLRRTLDELAEEDSERDALLRAIDDPEETLFESLQAVGDEEFHEVVLELLALMAVSDGHLDPKEVDLVQRVAAICDHPFDEAELRAHYADFLKDSGRVKGARAPAAGHGRP